MAQWLTNLTRIYEDVRLIPGLGQLRIQHCHGLCTCIPPLAWELPYAKGVALKSKKKKKEKERKKEKKKKQTVKELRIGIDDFAEFPHFYFLRKYHNTQFHVLLPVHFFALYRMQKVFYDLARQKRDPKAKLLFNISSSFSLKKLFSF